MTLWEFFFLGFGGSPFLRGVRGVPCPRAAASLHTALRAPTQPRRARADDSQVKTAVPYPLPPPLGWWW